MIDKKTWKEFRDSGILWWINTILHTFGWAIVVEIDNEEVINAYPARVKFRGFSENNNAEGYIKVSKYLENNIKDIREEAES